MVVSGVDPAVAEELAALMVEAREIFARWEARAVELEELVSRVERLGHGLEGGKGGGRVLHDLTEAADLLSVSRRVVERLVRDGELASVTLGRRRLVAHEDLEAYAAGMRAER